jgi:hypothetical protein
LSDPWLVGFYVTLLRVFVIALPACFGVAIPTILLVSAIADCDRLRQVRLLQQSVAGEQRSVSTRTLILGFLDFVAVIGITRCVLPGNAAAAAG